MAAIAAKLHARAHTQGMQRQPAEVQPVQRRNKKRRDTWDVSPRP
eukprot:CAMPEP_0206479692 /NCGR_PEP_ID=MMETSP0324_2-20121206/36823_1 /ASSEMBLY_ACC=CAM_ASM_000836 /TAXON_ID=2866 /ORGANISM="Crypthecodinium cohnii, Strain Seligo" /LENGTH=44 /DNA_ID= /DNA_START= /DNA_END= /DNA_ORIENTATION=